jgi:hypothetical protein
MRELTTFEQRVLMQLENLEEENANLHNITKEAAFKIKRLEEEVHLILHVVDITPHIKFK